MVRFLVMVRVQTIVRAQKTTVTVALIFGGTSLKKTRTSAQDLNNLSAQFMNNRHQD